jgi:O-acetyl-ADP-ribose deacetylase (regulator of RNase III)
LRTPAASHLEAGMVRLMITFNTGNLLESNVEALVNTVNTVGVMGKGIALMFKETFPENLASYEAACKRKEITIGRMFVTRRDHLIGPKWIINFPTKKHWRHPSKIEWIIEGLEDLKRVIVENDIHSIALPPLGSGNGGLDWSDVRPKVESALGGLQGVDVIVFEPTSKYQNVSKRGGVEKLTPARAIVVELVRRYWILGIECTLLEIQKLAYLLERNILNRGLANPLNLQFSTSRYGPYADRLKHLLNALDGSYLHCEKRLADASPLDIIWFDDAKKDKVAAFLTTADAKTYRPALEATSATIDGFQSPLGMELLATVDWLLYHDLARPSVASIKAALQTWPGGEGASERKLRLFDDRLIALALARLAPEQREHVQPP